MAFELDNPMTSENTPTTGELLEGTDFSHLDGTGDTTAATRAAAVTTAAIGAVGGWGIDRVTKGRVGSLGKPSARQSLQNFSKNAAKTTAKQSTVGASKVAGAAAAKKVGGRLARLAVMAAVPGPAWAAAAGVAITVTLDGLLGDNRILKGIGTLFNASGPSTDAPPSGGNSWLPMTNPDD